MAHQRAHSPAPMPTPTPTCSLTRSMRRSRRRRVGVGKSFVCLLREGAAYLVGRRGCESSEPHQTASVAMVSGAVSPCQQNQVAAGAVAAATLPACHPRRHQQVLPRLSGHLPARSEIQQPSLMHSRPRCEVDRRRRGHRRQKHTKCPLESQRFLQRRRDSASLRELYPLAAADSSRLQERA